MEKTETAHVLSMMSSCYPSAKITKETAATYHRLLADLTYQDVAKAVDVGIAMLHHQEVTRLGGFVFGCE